MWTVIQALMRFSACAAEDAVLEGTEKDSLVSRSEQGQARNTFRDGLRLCEEPSLTRAIVVQIITGCEIFRVTSCDVRPHRLPSKSEDCGHRSSGYALNNRLREPMEVC